MKYPYEQDAGNDKFIFSRDADTAGWALDQAGGLLGSRREGHRPPTSITCQILDWADDCAYSIHDIEDALQARFLGASDLEDTRFVRRVCRRYEEAREGEAAPKLDFPDSRARMRDLALRIRPPRSGDERAHRKQALRDLLNGLITSVSVRPERGAPRVDFAWRLVVPGEPRITSALCKAIVWEAVITEPRVAAMSGKGKVILKELFDVLLEEVLVGKNSALFPSYYRPIIDACTASGELEVARGVCNFLALLTDMDALRLYASLHGSKPATIFDLA